MQSMPSPSPMLPPPVPRDALDNDQARKRLWYAVAAILFLLLLLLILLIWLLSGIGGGGFGAGGGGGGDSSGLMGSGGGTSDVKSNTPPSSSGNTKGSTAGDNAQAQPDAKSLADNERGKGSAPVAPPGDSTGGTEDSLTIYNPNEQAKPVAPSTVKNDDTPSSGASGAGDGSIASLSGSSNPFIGSGRRAKSIVYVVDASGSMLQNNRQALVNNSLVNAIEDLKSEQKFKLFFFSDTFTTDNISKGLLPANKNNKEKVIEWIRTISTGNGTQPLNAILAALDLNPEVIVVMSDGQFDGSIVSVITKKNGKKTRIDCIGMDEDIESLRRIAQENGGKYSQVASLPNR